MIIHWLIVIPQLEGTVIGKRHSKISLKIIQREKPQMNFLKTGQPKILMKWFPVFIASDNVFSEESKLLIHFKYKNCLTIWLGDFLFN